MPDSQASRDHDVTKLTAVQRDWIRREGRVARVLEAAQRRGGSRFVRSAAQLRGAATRPPARPST